MDIDKAVIQESAVDWITATAQREDKAGRLAALGSYLCDKLVQGGDTERLFDWRGYTLHRAGGCAYGTRYDGTMLQLSGALASSHFTSCAIDAEHCARLDLQVTARVNPDNSDLATRAYIRSLSSQVGSGQRATFTHYENSKGGSTLYIGSRKSEQMGRLYNKWAESTDEQYRGCWRYEVELKNDLATHCMMRLNAVADRVAFIGGFVYKWFAGRGINPVFDSTSPVDLVHAPAVPSDAEKQLAWLHHGVRPTVDRLIKAGLLTQVLRSLGLEHIAAAPGDPYAFAAIGNHSGDLEGV